MPDFVKEIEMNLHLLRKKVELSIMLACRRDQVVLLQGSHMMLGHAIMNIQGICELIDIMRRFSEKIDDSASVDPASRPG